MALFECKYYLRISGLVGNLRSGGWFCVRRGRNQLLFFLRLRLLFVGFERVYEPLDKLALLKAIALQVNPLCTTLKYVYQ